MKLDLSNILTADMLQLREVFEKSGFEIRIVGGAVRDMLLMKHPKDIDFATNATPDEMKEIFDDSGLRWISTGEEHGTLTVVGPETKEPFEITTLRIDEETFGRHAVVKFTRSWKEDSNRRDLTYNAMSMDFDGNVYDYHNGIQDLRRGITRFVGSAEERIEEDYLRILRMFRFSGRYNHTLSEREKQAIQHTASGLENISGERIWMELSKILAGSNTDTVLRDMQETGVSSVIGIHNDPSAVLIPKKYTNNPVTILMAITPDKHYLEHYIRDWKWSNVERKLAEFLLEYRSTELNVEIAKNMIVDGVPKEYIIELAALRKKPDIILGIKNWIVPDFPITGRDLIQVGVTPGPGMGEVLSAMRNTWKQSGFELSGEELLQQVQQQKNKQTEDKKMSGKFGFIKKEITETKMFRYQRSLTGLTVKEIAEVLFGNILMLQVMRTENPRWAKNYAGNMLRYGTELNSMKASAPDLYNLVVVIMNKTEHDLEPSSEVVPQHQLLRFLRDIRYNRNNPALDRQLLLTSEKMLSISDSHLRAARRVISDWNKASPTEKSMAVSRLSLFMVRGFRLEDMYTPFIESTSHLVNPAIDAISGTKYYKSSDYDAGQSKYTKEPEKKSSLAKSLGIFAIGYALGNKLSSKDK